MSFPTPAKYQKRAPGIIRINTQNRMAQGAHLGYYRFLDWGLANAGVTCSFILTKVKTQLPYLILTFCVLGILGFFRTGGTKISLGDVIEISYFAFLVIFLFHLVYHLLYFISFILDLSISFILDLFISLILDLSRTS
jgi:hypothetical protein